MSRAYNTDGMMIFPESGSGPVGKSALRSIECAIAFDVRDWAADGRSAWIYAIVFGWEEDAWDEVAQRFGWDEEDQKVAEAYHKQWEQAKAFLEERRRPE